MLIKSSWFLSALTGTLLTATSVLAAPIATAEQPVFDFGKITQGEKVTHIFTLKNKGDEPLTILKSGTSCGCTVAEVTPRIVPPGKKAEIKSTFDSTNFSGVIHKTINIETNDPKTPNHTFTIKGLITEEIQVSPRQLNLGGVKAGIGKNFSVTVENKGSKPFKVTSVTSPMPQLDAKDDKATIRPGESATINVTITPKSGDRFLSGFMTIITDHPKKRELSIPIYGSVIQ